MGASGLGQLLVQEGILQQTDRLTIRKTTGNCPAAFAKAIVALGLLDEEGLTDFLVKQGKQKRAAHDLHSQIDPEVVKLVDKQLMQRLEILPLQLKDQTLVIAMADPLDRSSLRQIEFFTGYRIKPLVASLSEIHQCLKSLLPDFQPSESKLETFLGNHLKGVTSRQRQLDDEVVMDDLEAPITTENSATSEDQIEFNQVDDSGFDEDMSGNTSVQSITNLESLPALDGDAEIQAAPISDTIVQSAPADAAPSGETTASSDLNIDVPAIQNEVRPDDMPNDLDLELPQVATTSPEEIAPQAAINFEELSSEVPTEASEMPSTEPTPEVSLEAAFDAPMEPEAPMESAETIASDVAQANLQSSQESPFPEPEQAEQAVTAPPAEDDPFSALEDTASVSSESSSSQNGIKFTIAMDAKLTHEAIADINRSVFTLSSKKTLEETLASTVQCLAKSMPKGALMSIGGGQSACIAHWDGIEASATPASEALANQLIAAGATLSDFEWTKLNAEAPTFSELTSWITSTNELWGCLVPAKNERKLALVMSTPKSCMQNIILKNGVINILKIVARHA